MQIYVVACAGSSSARKWLCNFAKPGVGGLVARFKPSLSDNRFSRGRRRGRGMPLTWPWATPGCNANCYMPMRSRLMVRWSRKPARNGRLGGSRQKQEGEERVWVAVAGTHACLQNLRIRGHRLGQGQAGRQAGRQDAPHPCPSLHWFKFRP